MPAGKADGVVFAVKVTAVVKEEDASVRGTNLLAMLMPLSDQFTLTRSKTESRPAPLATKLCVMGLTVLATPVAAITFESAALSFSLAKAMADSVILEVLSVVGSY